MGAASTTNRLRAIRGIIGHDPVGPRAAAFANLAKTLPGVTTDDLLEVNLALAKRRKSQNFYDQAIPPLLAAAATSGLDASRLTRIRLELAATYRVLGNDAEARRIYQEVINAGGAAAQVNAAYRGLLETIVTPTEYDWVPTRAALDDAASTTPPAQTPQPGGRRLHRPLAPAFIAGNPAA